MTFTDGTIRKVLKLLLKYKLSPEGTIVTGELTDTAYFYGRFRIIDCNISHAEHTLYPIHSFDNDKLCFDKSRNDTISRKLSRKLIELVEW